MMLVCGNIQCRGAGVVESEDTADLKSAGVNPRAGSSPAARTIIKKQDPMLNFFNFFNIIY